MFDPDPTLAGVDTVAHIIQTALTPVFLLSGIAALMNVFSSRLARVSDRSHALATGLDTASGAARRHLEAQLRYLQHRTRYLDAAVLLGTFAGGATCLAALLLFVGTLRDAVVSSLLYASFGLALLCTTGALTAFMVEVLMASRGLRARQDEAVQRSEARGRGERGTAAEDGDSPDAPDNRAADETAGL